MIEGEVSPDRTALVQLSLPLIDGSLKTVTLMVDTGFNGHLMLPPEIIEMTDAKPWGPRRSLIADGSTAVFPAYLLDVIWEGDRRRVTCLSAPKCHLLGMSLMYGYSLRIDIVDGGRVTIRQRLG